MLWSNARCTAAVTGDSDSGSEENRPPPTKKQKGDFLFFYLIEPLHNYHIHCYPPAPSHTITVCPNCEESCHIHCAQKTLAKDLWEAVHTDEDVIKVRSLLGHGACPNHPLYWSVEWDELPPLHWACLMGLMAIMRTLVTHGARTDKGGGRDNRLPFHYACEGGHKEVVAYLIHEVRCSTGK